MIDIDAVKARHLDPEKNRGRTYYEGHIEVDLAACVAEIERLQALVDRFVRYTPREITVGGRGKRVRGEQGRGCLVMSPLAHTLLCAIRYAHGRSLHPYEEVIAAVREVWPQLDPASRRYWLDLVEAQVPSDVQRMIEAHTGGSLPVSREELEVELQHYLHLFRWCRENLALGTCTEAWTQVAWPHREVQCDRPEGHDGSHSTTVVGSMMVPHTETRP